MPVQMFVGGVEIQMRLSGSEAVADGPYSFSSMFAFVSTFSPGAIAWAAPLICQVSRKKSGGGAAAPRPCAAAVEPSAAAAEQRSVRVAMCRNMPRIIAPFRESGRAVLSRGHLDGSTGNFPKDFDENGVGRGHARFPAARRKIMRKALISSAVLSVMLLASAPAKAQVSFGVQIGEPPAPRAYRVPAQPRGDFGWVEGYGYLAGRQYRWTDGCGSRRRRDGDVQVQV